MADVNNVDPLAVEIKSEIMEIEVHEECDLGYIDVPVKCEDSEEKKRYDKSLLEFFDSHVKSESNVKKPWTQERIKSVIEQLKKIKANPHRTSTEYYWINKYDLFETEDGAEVLTYRKKGKDGPYIPILPIENYYNVLSEVHEATAHGGRQKIDDHLKKNNLHVPKKAIEIFLKHCSDCENKRAAQRRSNTLMPKIVERFDVLTQVGLIDLRSTPDGEYHWLMTYQDQMTKYLRLRPLKTNEAKEVAMELLKLLLDFGAPSTLRCDEGIEFTVRVIEEIQKLWPKCKIQCSEVEGLSNKNIETLVRRWMIENLTINWSVGCYFVQFNENRKRTSADSQ